MKKRKVVGSTVLGNIVEYYDFGIYAMFAHIIGAQFFPVENQYIQTLYSWLIFALGFMTRPMGGIIFGYIGDKVGRKSALTISIIGMALCTLSIALLPGYAQIGIAAPFILAFIRLCQGICIGGEGAGSAIFILEHLHGYKPGLIGSIVMASNMVGTLLAVFISILITHFFDGEPQAWRYGFLLGAMMGVIGLYMRYNLEETPVFQESKKGQKSGRLPLVQVIYRKWKDLIVVAFLGGVTSSMAYTIRGNMKHFFAHLGYAENETLYLTTFALLNFIIMLPIFGIIADKAGYKKFFYTTCYCTILLVTPTFYMFANLDIAIVLLGLFIFAALTAAICAPAYPYAISSFAPELRYSGVAFSWNLGIAIFGGTMPGISTFLVKRFNDQAPSYYIAFLALSFMLVKYLFAKKSNTE
jgi:MHS family proline/betaine transporter-like MFS transporter